MGNEDGDEQESSRRSTDSRVATYQAEVAFSTEPHDVTIAGLGYTFIHGIREPFGVPDPCANVFQVSLARERRFKGPSATSVPGPEFAYFVK